MSEELKFGTGGIRGIMGDAPNQINKKVIIKVTRGLSHYLNAMIKFPKVAICYDSRINSKLFAETATAELVSNGISVMLSKQMMPVPFLSFAIKELKCDAGIMITASHNSREYNGYKVYNGIGNQIIDDEVAKIICNIKAISEENPVEKLSFECAFGKGCEYISELVYQKYLSCVAMQMNFRHDMSNLRVVYTPLNGVGGRPVEDIFKMVGIQNYTIVSEQKNGNGDFTTCPFPNPERRDVYDLAIKKALETKCDLIIATDPDCDRVGAMVFDRGQYVFLTGNEIGILLFNYICENCKNIQGKTLVTTIVSSPLVDTIATSYRVNIIRTLVGFKYIGIEIDRLKDDFIFGFEESNGFLTGQYARDKDGVLGAKLICQMTSFYKSKGLTLIDKMNQIYQNNGYCIEKSMSFDLTKVKYYVNDIMDGIRDMYFLNSIPFEICKFVDYKFDFTGLPVSDVLEFNLIDNIKLTIRPSGTEPKIKVYISALGSDNERLRAEIDRVSEIVKEVIIGDLKN